MSDGRRKDEQRYLLRLPGDLADEIRAFATDHQRSFNSEVVWALRQYVRAVRKDEHNKDG